ncbi:MAG: hypothetical protein QW818_01460 [Candidatus Aenigmatarchaeota archaeon]|nr:hypothetical protein [Candidatus Aenigmarchaeota archaeon]
MLKSIAVQAVFLIAVIAISLFFIVAIFWGWIDTTKFGTSEASCAAKKTSYCSSLLNNRPPPFDWDKKEPTDCEQFGITKPNTKEDCK